MTFPGGLRRGPDFFDNRKMMDLLIPVQLFETKFQIPLMSQILLKILVGKRKKCGKKFVCLELLVFSVHCPIMPRIGVWVDIFSGRLNIHDSV